MLRFLEDRLGIGTTLRNSRRQAHSPQGIGYLHSIGFAALTVLVLQVISGVAMAFHYVPTTDLAYDSIRAIEADVVYGSLVRSMHHFGASVLIVFAVLQMMRVYFTAAYKKPRELSWLTGLGLLVLVLGFGFTGSLLPWDQLAYFGTKTRTEMASSVPVIGEHVRELIRGGADVGQPTLTRFYVVHVVLLPIALLAMLGLHFYLIHRHGIAAPGRPVGDEGDPGQPYFPAQAWKGAVVGVVVAGGLFWASSSFRAPLEALADPSDSSYLPRPEWYFAGLSYLITYSPTMSDLGTFWIPTSVVLVLALLPFVDRGQHRDWRKRRVMTAAGVLALIAVVVPTVLGLLLKPEQKSEGSDAAKAVAVTHPTVPFPLGLTDMERRGYVLFRRMKCLRCHAYEKDGVTYTLPDPLLDPKKREDFPRLNELETETIEDVAAVIEEGSGDDMPAFPNLSSQDRLAIGAFVRYVIQDVEKDK